MYFDEEPKHSLEDFYDREGELKEFLDSIRAGRKLILAIGLRRSGKTSLLNVGLALANLPYLIVDVRELAKFPRATHSDLLRILERAIRRMVERHRVMDFLKRVKGVKIYGFEIEFERGEKKPDLGELFEELDRWAGKKGKKVVVAFDEAQLLARATTWRFQMFLAHAYDYLRNTIFILTGSEVGLLYDFLGVDDPEAPLYGRHREEVKLDRFSEEKSRDFLLKGFKQARVKASADVIDYAVKKLDGIVGWLTAFGGKALKMGTRKEVVDEVLEEESKLSIQELEHFLNVRMIAKKRYMVMVKGLAKEPLGWGNLKSLVEKECGPIYNKNFTELLHNLVKAGFVEQRGELYTISDPVLLYALKEKRR
ncbi:MAG: ATP-binding protein [Euryarchaeota archaeon]|nr:ATP-binding protein [Euryarchaeota archaeon]